MTKRFFNLKGGFLTLAVVATTITAIGGSGSAQAQQTQIMTADQLERFCDPHEETYRRGVYYFLDEEGEWHRTTDLAKALTGVEIRQFADCRCSNNDSTLKGPQEKPSTGWFN